MSEKGIEGIPGHGTVSLANKSGININPEHKGDFHRWAHVPQGQPIPQSKIQEGLHSKDPAVRKMANFANNARHFHHGKK